VKDSRTALHKESFYYSRNLLHSNLKTQYIAVPISITNTVKFAYNDAVYNDIPGKTIPSNVFGWFYMLCVVLLFVYNYIDYNNNPDIAMLF